MKPSSDITEPNVSDYMQLPLEVESTDAVFLLKTCKTHFNVFTFSEVTF